MLPELNKLINDDDDDDDDTEMFAVGEV